MWSNSQIDKLGDRLRAATPDQLDVEAFADFRETFLPVLQATQDVLGSLSPAEETPVTSRLKTLESTVAKLNRGRTRLSTIADIAGVRLVVPREQAQDTVVAEIQAKLAVTRTLDYRRSPQHGYRAVHLIVRDASGKLAEVQVRTRLQNAWANLSEALAYRFDRRVKYGEGPELALRLLAQMGDSIANLERVFKNNDELRQRLDRLRAAAHGGRGQAAADDSQLGLLMNQLRTLELETDRLEQVLLADVASMVETLSRSQS